MKLLISHVNYPSQFRRLIPSWVADGHDIAFIARSREWHAGKPEGIKLIQSRVSRTTINSSIHPYLRRLESAVLEGQSVYRAAAELQSTGWVPDVVISHLGFGNGFYLKECFPDSKRIGLVEWFYNSSGSDVDFLGTKSVSADHKLKLCTWNAETLLEISTLDKVVTPTFWQRNQFPEILRSSISVVHEGVDVDYLSSLEPVSTTDFDFLPRNTDVEILTYVSRCFEEYRGFPQAIETISQLQKKRPNLHAILVGTDGTAYGNARPDGLGWSEWAKQNLDLDPNRTHWLGSLQEDEYHRILKLSNIHLYLTVPFVLSWSLLESMAVGCPIVASNTPPVQEVLDDGISGLLVDFHSIQDQVNAVCKVLDNESLSSSLSKHAQTTVRSYSTQAGSLAWNKLLGL